MNPPCVLVVSGPPYVSETFIRLHEARLRGPKIILQGPYPAYQLNASSLRSTFGWSTASEKLLRCIPAAFYDKLQLKASEYVIARKALDRLIKSSNIGCVVAEYGQTGADLVPHLKPLGIPLIVFFHGHDAYHEDYLAQYRERFDEMFRYASVLFVVSDDMRIKLLSMGAPSEKIKLNPYGPREHFFDCASVEKLFILGLGRFVETKAPYLTLLAFSQALKFCPNARLVLAGSGPMLPVCRDIASALKISEYVDFPGQVAPDVSFELFQKARFFVQHSVTTAEGVKEGTPVAILEASAAGLPILATRHAGIEQAVIHGQTGFLVEERDVDSMANYIAKLWQDEDLRCSLGRNAREHIRVNYSLDSHLQALQAAIDTCMKEFC